MADDAFDEGPPADLLRTAAWVLAVVAVGSLLRVLVYAGDGTSVQTELFVWVLLGAVSAAFSAGCFVVLAVTLAERRLAGQARSLRKLMTDRR